MADSARDTTWRYPDNVAGEQALRSFGSLPITCNCEAIIFAFQVLNVALGHTNRVGYSIQPYDARGLEGWVAQKGGRDDGRQQRDTPATGDRAGWVTPPTSLDQRSPKITIPPVKFVITKKRIARKLSSEMSYH